MPNYAKLRELVSHRITVEYDTGARIVGYLSACRPENGAVQFIKLDGAEMVSAEGETLPGMPVELWISPNVMTNFALEEGPSGRTL